MATHINTRKGIRFVKGLNFTGWMWLSLAVVVGLSIQLTMQLEESRKLPGDYGSIESTISSLEVDIAELSEISPLPLLETQWRLMSAKASISRVQMEAVTDPESFGFENTYTGPLKNWAAVLTGEPKDVLALAQTLQREIPVFLYDYTVDSEVMKLNVVVVGI